MTRAVAAGMTDAEALREVWIVLAATREVARIAYGNRLLRGLSEANARGIGGDDRLPYAKAYAETYREAYEHACNESATAWGNYIKSMKGN